MKISNVFKHFRKICTHKYYVCKYCFKFGLYKQGLLHDLSKFSPIEFWTSVKYYQGNSSPIDAEKLDKGYSLAWYHHFHRNKHHWAFWIDFNSKQEITPCKIPYKYIIESICDWLGAGAAYNGKEYTMKQAYEYYQKRIRIDDKTSNVIWHKDTKNLYDTIMLDLLVNGLETVIRKHKKGIYKQKYYMQN